MRTPIPGFNYFKCEECGEEWIDSTRDIGSPSGDSCYCGNNVVPECATTTQYDNLKFKLTPLGVPAVPRVGDVDRYTDEILRLRSEIEHLARDHMYCAHCACQSCYDETQLRLSQGWN